MSTQTIIVLISIGIIFAIIAVTQLNRTDRAKSDDARDEQDSGDA